MNKTDNTQLIPMKEQIANFLRSIEYKFLVKEETENLTVIQTGVSLTVGASIGYIVIHHNLNLVEFLAYSPVHIPENKRIEVGKFVAYVDSISYIGNLQLNYQKGDLRCKTYLNYTEDPVNHVIIRDNFIEGFNCLERYLPSIMSIVYSGKDADAAIRDVMNQVDPTQN